MYYIYKSTCIYIYIFYSTCSSCVLASKIVEDSWWIDILGKPHWLSSLWGTLAAQNFHGNLFVILQLLFCFIWTICWNHVSSQLKKKVQLSCKVCLRFLHFPFFLPPPSRHLQQHRRFHRNTRGVNPTRSGRLGQCHDLALHQRRRRV